MHRYFAVAGLCLTLGACASYTPGATASAYDGEYTGTITQTHAGANSCGSTTPKPGALKVQNGSVVWTTPSSDTMYAPVMQNGAFQTNENITMFSGKITDKAMVARMTTGTCHIVYDLTRKV